MQIAEVPRLRVTRLPHAGRLTLTIMLEALSRPRRRGPCGEGRSRRSSQCMTVSPVRNSTFSLGIYLTIYLSIYLNYLAVRVRKQYNFLMGRLNIIVAVFITE